MRFNMVPAVANATGTIRRDCGQCWHLPKRARRFVPLPWQQADAYFQKTWTEEPAWFASGTPSLAAGKFAVVLLASVPAPAWLA